MDGAQLLSYLPCGQNGFCVNKHTDFHTEPLHVHLLWRKQQLYIDLITEKSFSSNSLMKTKHTLHACGGYCDLFVCICLFFNFCWPIFLCLCVAGQRLMRYECILPSSMVFLGVMVKVDLCTRQWVHGWWRQGHVSPTCPIRFRGLCSTLRLLFLSSFYTWGSVKRPGSWVFSTQY